jgi:hypothetical protein
MSLQNPATQAGHITASVVPQPQTPPRQPLPNIPPRRPLRREGAFRFEVLTPAEQAMEDAMLASSSPLPESVLGKRTRSADDPGDGGDTEPDEPGASGTWPRSELPSISNVAAIVFRYATTKKLRPEQRDEVDAFLLVSAIILTSSRLLLLLTVRSVIGHCTQPTGQIVYLLAYTTE